MRLTHVAQQDRDDSIAMSAQYYDTEWADCMVPPYDPASTLSRKLSWNNNMPFGELTAGPTNMSY